MKSVKEIADSLSGEEREAFILSLQSKDTQFLILEGKKRNEIEQALYVKEKADRMIGKEAQVLKEDGSVDLNVRPITKEEAEAYQEFRRKRGAWIEEVRTAYLMKKIEEGKIDPSLPGIKGMIDTPHVSPGIQVRERAVEAFVRGSILQVVKDKFKEIMNSIFKPSHAEIVAEEMRKMNGK